MTLFERFTNVVKANISDVLDKAEDPEKAIKMWLENAKTELENYSVAVGEAVATEKTLQKQFDDYSKEIQYWQSQAEVAVAGNRDDLASKSLEKQDKIKIRMESVKTPQANAHANAFKMKENMQSMKEKIEETQANGDVLIARAKAAKAMVNSEKAMSRISGSSPLDQMDSLEKKIISQEAHAEAISELSNSKEKSLDDEINALSSKSNVENRLAEIKAKMGQK